MSTTQATRLNSPEWLFFVKSSFVLSVCAMFAGIVFSPRRYDHKKFLCDGHAVLGRFHLHAVEDRA